MFGLHDVFGSLFYFCHRLLVTILFTHLLHVKKFLLQLSSQCNCFVHQRQQHSVLQNFLVGWKVGT